MKVALVTGGAGGIGAAVVKRLTEEGAKVYFTVHTSAKEMKADPRAIVCDVRNSGDVEKAVDYVIEKESRVDILVNNAGIIRDGLFLAMSDEDWQSVLDTNLGGTYRFCKAVLGQMLMQGGGRVINISSVIADLGGFGQANYASSKAAINGLTRALAAEFAPKHITVNAVAPGMVNTRMSEASRAAFGDRIREKIPMGEFAEPSEIAAVVAFLASDEARYITGQIVTVDGGLGLLGRK